MHSQIKHKQDALLQAIDFFTQKFNINQLSSYAFEFTYEMLSLSSAALFIKEENFFRLEKVKNYDKEEYFIEDTAKLQRLATLHGNVMTTGFESYFEKHDIEAFDTALIIPLIIKDLLYGFIISRGKGTGSIDEADLMISKALMQLINNALESSKNYSELQSTNIQLDQKIFNLFSINQSSRMLLSELDLQKLYSLAIDIFSELTSSRITSFGLYDEIKDCIVLRGYKDVFSNCKYYGDFHLKNNIYNGYKVVFHYKKDKELLQEIFANYDDFEHMEAEYIILIVKGKVLGFVTISKPVNDRAYDQSLFELIESLAASTYISFKNAIYFNEINRQRISIQQKLHILTNLNNLIKNINSCLSIEELCEIAIKTLQYSFDIKKAFIALREKDSYIIKKHFGFELTDYRLEPNENWASFHDESLTSFVSHSIKQYFSPQLSSDIGSSNCLVISPIASINAELDDEACNLGYLVVLQTSENLKEEEVLLIETMASSITPVVNHLQELKHVKQEYIINQREAFIKSLNSKYFNRDKYLIDYYIYYKKIIQFPFKNINLDGYAQYEHYYFDNILLVISYDKLENEHFDGCLESPSIEDVINKL